MKTFGYTINGEFFKTKKSVQEKVRGIMKSYGDGQYLHKEDFDFMFGLLSLHPDAEQKIGCGVDGISVDKNPVYHNTRCFFLVRYDGAETDFSYLECLKETSQEKRFYNACRVSAEPYTRSFKDQFFAEQYGDIPFCPYTGEVLEFVGSHVDHRKPNTFKKIVEDFVKQYGIDVNSVRLYGRGIDNCFQDSFAEKDIEDAFTEYHNKVADLQVVSKKANLGMLK